MEVNTRYINSSEVLEDVPLGEFTYLVSTHMPGVVTTGDSGLCCISVMSFEC